MARLAINPADVTNLFLTHLHSDHIVSLPELYLFPWASQGRSRPLRVWGPDGTRSMVRHLQDAFWFDVHVRRDVDNFPAEGIKVTATGRSRRPRLRGERGHGHGVLASNHGPIKPALGYRVDYRGRSVAMSGDTKPSDNLIKFSQGVDVLIHEVGRSKQDPAFSHYNAAPSAVLPLVRQSYAGPVEFGEDSPITMPIAAEVSVHRFVRGDR